MSETEKGVSVFGKLIVCALVIGGILLYGNGWSFKSLKSSHLGPITEMEDIRFNQEAYIGKVVTVGGNILLLNENINLNRISVTLKGGFYMEFLLTNETLKNKFRKAKVKAQEYIIFKGKLKVYSNKYELYMDVEDFDY